MTYVALFPPKLTLNRPPFHPGLGPAMHAPSFEPPSPTDAQNRMANLSRVSYSVSSVLHCSHASDLLTTNRGSVQASHF